MMNATANALKIVANRLTGKAPVKTVLTHAHPCQVMPLGKKHKEAILAYWCRNVSSYGQQLAQHLNTACITGQFLLITKPEHIKDAFSLSKEEQDWLVLARNYERVMDVVPVLCPMCGSWMYPGSEWIVTPYPCHGCARVFWTFCQESDTWVNYEKYVQMALEYDGIDPWGEKGIPVDVYNQVRSTERKAPKRVKSVGVGKIYE